MAQHQAEHQYSQPLPLAAVNGFGHGEGADWWLCKPSPSLTSAMHSLRAGLRARLQAAPIYRRAIHASQSALAAKRQGPAVGAVPYIPGLELTEEELEGEEDTFNDTSSIGHEILEQQRQALNYMRLIEHEMPQLVGEFRGANALTQLT